VLQIPWCKVEQAKRNMSDEPYMLKLTIFHASPPLWVIRSTVPRSDSIAAKRCDAELKTSSVTWGDPSRENSRG
jgi:hypothetical protein